MKTLFKNSAIEIILYYKGIILAVFFNDDNQLEVVIPFFYFRFSFGGLRWRVDKLGYFIFGMLLGSFVAFLFLVIMVSIYYELIPQK